MQECPNKVPVGQPGIPIAVLILAALTPIEIIGFDFPGISITLSPIRIAVVLLVLIFVFRVAIRGKARITAGEAVFFTIGLGLNIGSVIQSSSHLKVSNFMFFSFLLFCAIYLITAWSLREGNLSSQKLIRLIIIQAIVVTLIGFLDWGYSLFVGENLWKILFGFPESNQFIASVSFQGHVVPRLTALFPDPNLYGYFVLLPFLVSVAILTGSRREYQRLKRVSAIAVLVLGGGLLLSMSRSALFLSMIGVVIVAAMSGLRSLKFIFLFAMAILFVLIGFYSSSSENIDLMEIVNERSSISNINVENEMTRYLRFQSGLAAFENSPVFGVGYGGMGEYIPSEVKHPERITSHSFILDVFAALGLVGGLWFLTGIAAYIIRGMRRVSADSIKRTALFWIGLILASQIVYSNLLSPAFAFQLAVIAVLFSTRTAASEYSGYRITRTLQLPQS